MRHGFGEDFHRSITTADAIPMADARLANRQSSGTDIVGMAGPNKHVIVTGRILITRVCWPTNGIGGIENTQRTEKNSGACCWDYHRERSKATGIQLQTGRREAM
jgi:hypothetical protein